MKFISYIILLFQCYSLQAQNALNIPPALTGTVFNLNIQSGTKIFYGTTPTPTYGINGVWMAPTIMVNKGDSITLNVINNLSIKTTMHWHGLHVASHNDGGPHQPINPSTTWSASFKIRNNAGTYWYHPHGAGQTDLQVSKGLAGMLIVKDNAEAAINLPRTYGVDDIPIMIQSKAFDDLKQIAIATDMDTALFVNGTLYPYLNIGAQVIRLRLLNGSSLRSYNFGFSNAQSFYQIATDGGLLDSSIALTRLHLSPGERAEILVNFSGMLGQTIYFKSFSAELPKGIYGADSVGDVNNSIDDYKNNFLNGANFNLLKIIIGASTMNAVTTIPTTLIPFTPFNILSATKNRTIVFDTIRLLPADIPNRADGPFGMNNKSFDMDSINEVVYLNTTEIWKLVNRTLVAHPFHIHDVQFNVIEKSGMPALPSERGWKDVVLVMPNDSVKFITKYTDFADNTIPYMYHCHLLHHEDDGMMGSFLVIDTTIKSGVNELTINNFSIYPNPTNDYIFIENKTANLSIQQINITDALGRVVLHIDKNTTTDFPKIKIAHLPNGPYFIQLISDKTVSTIKIIKQ
jgi:bilirubin oxidase